MYVCMYVFLRTITRNASCILLFRLPRDRSSVMAIGRQIYPENPGALLEAYSKALTDHE